jgi:hypothetical protein
MSVFIFYYTVRYNSLSDSYCPNFVRIWLVATTEIGDQDVDAISQSLLISSVFASRIQLSWSIVLAYFIL